MHSASTVPANQHHCELGASVLGKRPEPEAGNSSSGDSGSVSVKDHIMRLSHHNHKLQIALNNSQEEVKKLMSVIEKHDNQDKKTSKDDKAQTRYWTDAEHELFLDALMTVGPKNVKAIAQHVITRSVTQVRTHAQKYFIKLARMKKSAEEAAKAGVPASAHGAWWLQVLGTPLFVNSSFVLCFPHLASVQSLAPPSLFLVCCAKP